MAIIEKQNPIIDTPETLALKEAAAIKAQINQGFHFLSGLTDQLFNRIWNHPKLPPQKLFDVFGNDSAQLFQIMGLIQNALNAMVPNSSVQKPPFQYKINADQTVSVGDAIKP